MRMFAQDRAFYRRVRVDGTDSEEARRRLWIVEGIEEMRERFPAEAACRTFGVSRATYYEWRRRLKEGGVSGLVSALQPSAAPRGPAVDDGRRGAGAGRSPCDRPGSAQGSARLLRTNPVRVGLPRMKTPPRAAMVPGHGCLTSSCLEGR